MANYDVIVIGGGHNGLTTAALLGQAGKKVLVLEKNDRLGGLAMEEEFHPGYKSPGIWQDTGRVRMNLVKKLDLPQYGLKTCGRRASMLFLSDDGASITVAADLEATVQSIAQVSEHDAQAYRSYRMLVDKISPWISKLMDDAQPDVMEPSLGEMMKMLRSGLGLRMMGKATMREVMKILPMCVADFLNEYFETDFLKAGLAGPALHATYNGPWSAFTTMNLILWEAMSREQVMGGPAALIEALEQAARHHGVEIQTGARVAGIQLTNTGEVEGVTLADGTFIAASTVAASCSPKAVFLDFLPSRNIGPKLEATISNLRCRGVTAKVNLALNQKIQWKAEIKSPLEFARTGQDFDSLEQAFDAVKYRQCSEQPVLDIFVPTVSNSELAPEGHEVVSILAQYAPYDLEGGWTDEAKTAFGDRVVAQLANHTTGLEDAIVARQVLTPADLATRYNLPGGHLFHAEHAVDQLVGRPIPSCAQYQTPITGLYLCGSGSHPGGGLTCAPGALAARVMLH